MNTNKKKPKLLLNFLLSLLIIAIAFAIDRSYDHQKAQKQTDSAETAQQAADSLVGNRETKSEDRDTADAVSDTAALLRREK
jgi:hypothetical protein